MFYSWVRRESLKQKTSRRSLTPKTASSHNVVLLLSLVGLFIGVGYVAVVSMASTGTPETDTNVSGRIMVAQPSSRAVARVDGTPVGLAGGTILDTTLLPNGGHRLEVIVKDALGSSVTTTKEIAVSNTLNPLEWLRNQLYLPLGGNVGIAYAAIVLASLALVTGLLAEGLGSVHRRQARRTRRA
jgi:hypothetical protein